jgi:hypothetical protein
MLSPNQKIHSQTQNPKNKNKSCPSNTAKRRFNSSNATPKTKIPNSFVNSKRTKTNQNKRQKSKSLSLFTTYTSRNLQQPKQKKIQQQQQGGKKEGKKKV